MDLLRAMPNPGPVYLVTVLAVYWYLCWWVTFAMIYLLIGTIMVIYFLVKWCICPCYRSADGVDDSDEEDWLPFGRFGAFNSPNEADGDLR